MVFKRYHKWQVKQLERRSPETEPTLKKWKLQIHTESALGNVGVLRIAYVCTTDVRFSFKTGCQNSGHSPGPARILTVSTRPGPARISKKLCRPGPFGSQCKFIGARPDPDFKIAALARPVRPAAETRWPGPWPESRPGPCPALMPTTTT